MKITNQRWLSGVPLGAIGCGKIELLTDGALGNFTINHNWDRPTALVRGAFFGVAAEGIGRILRSPSPDEYWNVTNIENVEYEGEFPFARVAYSDSALPVDVTLEAFSPLIPHNAADSSLPVATFAFRVRNKLSTPITASLVFAWENLLGTGGRRDLGWHDRSGAVQEATESGLRFKSKLAYSDQRQNTLGEYLIACDRPVTRCTKWDAARKQAGFWDSFCASGELADTAFEPSAGAIAAKVPLAPNATETVTFYAVWFMPKHLTVKPTLVPKEGTVEKAWDSGWTTSRPMQPGDQMVLDYGESRAIGTITFNGHKTHYDWPRGYRLEISADGKSWKGVLEKDALAVDNDQDWNLLPVPVNQTARFVRITCLGAHHEYKWTVQSIDPAPKSVRGFIRNTVTEDIIEDVGHYYLNRFTSADAILAYVRSKDLRTPTREWQELIEKSSLADWLKSKLTNGLFPLFANTILTQDGRFCVQEGPVDMFGSLGTMDQRMAAHAFYTMMFPDLDRTELEIYAKCAQPDGRITHFNGNLHHAIGDARVMYGVTDWPDLSCSFILQVFKLYRWTGDRAFLERMRPTIHAAFDWIKRADTDGDGIPEGGSTYDYENLPKGLFVYNASCVLAALRAGIEICKIFGEKRGYEEWFQKSQAAMIEKLWNGQFFIKWHKGDKRNPNSFIAQMAGDWFCRLAGLEPILPEDKIRSSIRQTLDRHLKPFYPVPPMEVTLDGKVAVKDTFVLQHEPYLGCEAIYLGWVEEGLEVIKRNYDVGWTVNRSPWNQGLNYTAPEGRPNGLITYMTNPTTWHVLPALAGATIDLASGKLWLRPQADKIPVFFSTFWGWLEGKSLKILKVFKPGKITSVNGTPVEFELKPGAVLNVS